MAIYSFPRVGRAGLGNCLFPWARAELFADRSGGRVLAPRWSVLKLGPYLRKEPEKRGYGRFFQAPHHVTGPTRELILATGQSIDEDQLEVLGNEFHGSWRPRIVEFSGTGKLFAPLTPHFAFLKRKLWEMTRRGLRPDTSQYGPHFIGLHIRRGDLTRQGFSDQQLQQDVYQYTPLSWFVSMVTRVKEHSAASNVPIVLFTDGDAREVAEVCKLPGVRLHKNQKAIADLWTMSTASLLFASGYSTFSMWASFLGGMPTVYASGKMQQPVQTGRADACELELAENDGIPYRALAMLTSIST